jgi:hypothetical protein
MAAVPIAVWVVAGAALSVVLSIVPTCLFLYVEPRGRLQWARAGDTAASRRAPLLVRTTAWLSFLLAQLGLVWLWVPVACVGLSYLQIRLGIAKPLSLAATAVAGAMGVAEVAMGLRLGLLGVRLLVRERRECSTASGRARHYVFVSAILLAGSAALGWVVHALPGSVNTWLATALEWAAILPLRAYSAACLLHALLLGLCAPALTERAHNPRWIQ